MLSTYERQIQTTSRRAKDSHHLNHIKTNEILVLTIKKSKLLSILYIIMALQMDQLYAALQKTTDGQQ